jgi:hypothetical protein
MILILRAGIERGDVDSERCARFLARLIFRDINELDFSNNLEADEIDENDYGRS